MIFLNIYIIKKLFFNKQVPKIYEIKRNKKKTNIRLALNFEKIESIINITLSVEGKIEIV